MALVGLTGALALLLAGCGQSPTAPAPATESAAAPESVPPPTPAPPSAPSETAPAPVTAGERPAEARTAFENCFTTWASGDHEAAIAAFLQLDLGQPLFSSGSPLALSEAEYVQLPPEVRQQYTSRIAGEIRIIKELAQGVLALSRQAKESGDTQQAATSSNQLQRLGRLLDQAGALKISSMVGKRIQTDGRR